MIQDKPFRTIDEQIAILRSRGISVADEDRVTLIREGYYSVVNGYKDAFIDAQASSEAGDDRYRRGTSFEHLHLLFDLDRLLREQTFHLLVHAETTLRTTLAYAFSDRHRGPDTYLDPACYCMHQQYHNRRNYERDKANLLRVLRKAHDNRWGHPPIDHYLSSYGHVPLWVLVNVLTFGNVSHLYALSTIDVRNEVCRMVSELQGGERIGVERLRKSMSTLVEFRNICAHDDRLYCARVGRHRERSYADMLEALEVVVDHDHLVRYKKGVVKSIGHFDRVPSIKNEVLRGMGVTIVGNELVRVSSGRHSAHDL